jgi:hypothetical protein
MLISSPAESVKSGMMKENIGVLSVPEICSATFVSNRHLQLIRIKQRRGGTLIHFSALALF